jgi:hypothetical protein
MIEHTTPKRRAKGFQGFHAVADMASYGVKPPKEASFVGMPGMFGGAYVPVSFVAKDWGVTPRRIRALLTSGRLLGRLLENGHWEVKYPYLFTFGTRGPSLKRQERPPKRPKKPELKAV